MSVYTPQEKLQIIKWHYGGNSSQQCVDLFSITFENRPIPCKQTILNIVSKFENTFCLKDCSKCRGEKEKAPEIIEAVEQREILVCSALGVQNTQSTRSVAKDLGVSHNTVAKIWKKNGFKCFKYSKTQKLFPEDNFRRMEFCETMMERANQNENFIKNILFTDESFFSLHNPSIVRYWAQENQHKTFVKSTQFPQKLNVWEGILGDHLIGPFFIEGTLNCQKYLELLQTAIVPAIQNLPGVNPGDIWYQQDGCPIHNSARVKEFLTNTFPARVIGTTGTIKWPARSPDLSPNDFFLWGYLKGKIFNGDSKPQNLEELRARIIDASNSVDADMLARVRNNFYNRLGYCLAREGGEFEAFL